MSRRRPMSRKSSRRTFKKGLNRQHSKNRWMGQRGGIRL